MTDFGYSVVPASSLDAEIGEYILSNPNGDFSEVITRDLRWQVFYHLSNQPTGILSWYPFHNHSSLLQIGGGFGVHSGILCDRCGSVTVLEADAYRAESIRTRWIEKSNLKVLNGDISMLPSGSVFDYIVIIVGPDFQEPVLSGQGYISLLRQVRSLLTDDGKLLFSVFNRLGVQYLCGAPDPSTGIPFDGLNNYPTGAAMPSLSKPELMDILRQVGLKNVKLYYPFPDHLLPQMVYTDQYPPGEELNERLRPYQVKQDSLVINPSNLYGPLAENGLIPFFANSFLAECSNAEMSSVLYASISAERSREESFSTSIHNNGLVEKCPIYKEGLSGLDRLCKNLTDLQSRDIPVISFRLENDRLIMPRIQAPTLSVYLRKLITYDAAGFIRYMDELYKYVLNSSEHTSSDENALAFLDPNIDWGPILSKAYLEMIPVNCFFDNGQFLFFDQEFVKENYPAKYVMFRAINDIYWFAPHTEQYVSRHEMKERYGLTELWPFFLKEERRFQDQLRQREMYKQFYKWASIDLNNIMRNGRLLLMEKSQQIHANIPKRERIFAAVDGVEGKLIVLFGAGRMMEHYLKKYGSNYPPSYIIDNDKTKWNTEKHGFLIQSPQLLKELIPGQYRVIICNAAYDEIARQLQGMGIKEYRIYQRELDEIQANVEIVPHSSGKYNIGYVTGVFDLFHIGHLNILRRSKERCEYLIAGVLTDELAERDKKKKPFISFEERLAIVQQIKYVDRVIAVDFNNTNKIEAWKQLRYDCHFSGNDHEEEWYWLQKQLQTLGSNMEFIPYTESTSSTKLQQMINMTLI
jgi:cytidyltransferase-like protein